MINELEEENNVDDENASMNSAEKVQDWLQHEHQDEIPNENVQQPTSRDYVLEEAFKALQSRQVKDLPKFDGNMMKWPTFKKHFEKSTTEFHIKPYQNLVGLEKALEGEAKEAVQSLLGDEDNIPTVMKILETNFGNKDWVAIKRLEKLEKLEPVKEDNIVSFRKFYNEVYGSVAAIENVDAEDYLSNLKIVMNLSEKLPAHSRRDWIKHKSQLERSGKKVSTKTFLAWLGDEMQNFVVSYNPSKKTYPNLKTTKPIMNVNGPFKKPSKCPLCNNKEHNSLVQCELFKRKTIEERRETAKKLLVCFNCLTKGNGNRNCPIRDQKCRKCGFKHHELVHLPKEGETDLSEKPMFQLQDTGDCHSDASSECDEIDPETNILDPVENLILQLNLKGDDTLLRFGKVHIQGPAGSIDTYAIFDEGSTRSLLSQNIAKKLGLSGSVRPVTYRWMNDITHTDYDSMNVSCKISGPDKKSSVFEMKNVRTINGLQLPKSNFDVDMFPLPND